MATTPTYPEQVPVDAYGNGGFRFAGMSHRGSLLLLPSGVFAWPPTDANTLAATDFTRVFEETGSIEFLMLGTGAAQIFPAPELRNAFAERGLGLEAMDTGAACRAYNVLLAEKRAFAAAVIAVE
ncbi:MAG: Mth938-like domain-containing protein [Hyphomicrobiaceae bacterium]